MNPVRSFINITILIIAVCGLVGIVKAEPVRGSCSIAAKAKKNPPEPSTTKKAPKRSLPAVVITYEGSRKPVSFDSSGNATYHEDMIPVMKAVNLPDLPDATIATKRQSGLVESHVVMRLVAEND